MLLFRRLCRSQRQIFGIVVVVIICIITFYYTLDKEKIIVEDLEDIKRLVHLRLKKNVEQERGLGCNMPQLDPFAKEIVNFTEYIPNVTCEGTDWVTCFKSECFVTKAILKTMRDVSCDYRDIIYVNDNDYSIGNPTTVVGEEIYMLNRSDHVKVSCSGKDSLGLLPSYWYGYKAGFRPIQTNPPPEGYESKYNVMILCFDSTSHNGFIRNMHKTYKYLTEKLNAIILNSYNIVGDGTTGALYPILTGKAEEDHPDTRKIVGKDKYVDFTKFIFHLLKEHGYRTAYFEDMPWIGTFQYRYNGFRHQPPDHYLRAMLLDETSNGENWYKGVPARHCIGAIPYYKLIMDLNDQFLQLDGKKFSFTFIADISHDNFNLFSSADEPTVAFLRTLVERGVLNDTLLIIMGDHGSRFSTIRETYQGKLEERLPLMAFILPEKLKKLRPEVQTALQHNKDVLTTPFDIHTTLLDLLDMKNSSNPHIIPGSDLPRAMSLLEPIPKSRSCAEAGVLPHWCACTKWYNVSRSSLIYTQVANVLAEYINSISEEQRAQCARRNLTSIEWVLQLTANDDLKFTYINVQEPDRFLRNPKKAAPKSPDVHYQAKIIMSPGRGVFEGTMIYNAVGDYFMMTQRGISRVSAYGDEPSCIIETHPHLSKYCYCKQKINKRSAVKNMSAYVH